MTFIHPSEYFSDQSRVRPELAPGSAGFDQLTERMAAIAHAQAEGPKEDALHYETALLNAYDQANQYISASEQSTLRQYYQAVGERALTGTEAELDAQLKSAERLTGYVAEGLLDTITADELEKRSREIQGVKIIGQYLEVYEELFVVSALSAQVTEPSEQVVIPAEIIEEAPVKSLPLSNQTEAEMDEKSMQIESMKEIIWAHGNWTSAQRAYVVASMNRSVRIEELRHEVPEIAALTKDEYDELKSLLRSTRDQATVLLAEHDYKVEWSVTGKARGTRYELVTHKQPVTSVIAGKPEVVETKTDATRSEAVAQKRQQARQSREVSREWEAAALFTDDLLTGISGIMGQEKMHQRKQGYVSREIAKWLDVDREDASALVKQLIEGELLFVEGTDKGSPVLTLDAANAMRVRRKTRPARTENSATRQERPFTKEEAALAETICRTLLTTGHQNKGLTIRKLALALELEDKEVRPLVNRMMKAGVVNTEEGMERSRSPHSRKKTVLFVKFPTQNAWLRFKDEPSEYMAVLPTETAPSVSN